MIVPVNMPGGGGLVALNYVANAAPRDGTVLSMITQTFPMDQALGLEKNLKVDMLFFTPHDDGWVKTRVFKD